MVPVLRLLGRCSCHNTIRCTRHQPARTRELTLSPTLKIATCTHLYRRTACWTEAALMREVLHTAGAHGNTSCLTGRTTASTKTQCILRCRTAAGRKPGRAAKEAEGRRQTERIIVHTHSCGLPCSINTSPTHDSIVRAAQSLHWSTEFTLHSESPSGSLSQHTHRHIYRIFF